MRNSLSVLITIMEASVKKHGPKPLTNEHLLNILKVAADYQELLIENEERSHREILNKTDPFGQG